MAVDVNTGEIAWQVPFGTVEGAPPGVETGAPNSQTGGPTSTASGLFFIGGATDRRRSRTSFGFFNPPVRAVSVCTAEPSDSDDQILMRSK